MTIRPLILSLGVAISVAGCASLGRKPSPTVVRNYCDIYTPIRWSSLDTRLTKEQVDKANRIWKRICKNK